MFEAEKFKTDVTSTPIPRFDLLNRGQYTFYGVQFARGRPFNCEFCDIIELYGRVPRAKAVEQMLAELDTLYCIGYRGHLDFVDDNFIGNKKPVKAFLPHLIAWQKKRWEVGSLAFPEIAAPSITRSTNYAAGAGSCTA